MTTAKNAARHRKARRPLAPVTDTLSSLSMNPVRGTAVVSVTGLALTAAVSAAANAAPVALADSVQQSPTAKISTLPTTVTVPDIAWTASDEVAASAEAPAPEPEPEPVETVTVAAPVATAAAATAATTTTEVASRSETREAVAAPASAAGSSIASIALNMQGIPYVYGGSSWSGADCSGFVQMVYAQAGISLPRTSQAQQASGTIIPASAAQAGDLVSWGYHIGIYLGDGMMVDSSKPGTVTSVRTVWGSPVYVRI